MPDDQPQQENNLEQLQQDLNAVTNNWKRALADFENYKRHKEKENRELVQFAREVTVAKLLPTLDVLGQALKHLPEYYTTPSRQVGTPLLSEEGSGPTLPLEQGEYPAQRGEGVDVDFAKKYSNWQIGIKGILMQLDQALSELGVKKIEAIGKKFDPHYHEAVKEVENEAEDGTIVDELVTGYELNGKVIRPSQVTISRKAANLSPEALAKGEGGE